MPFEQIKFYQTGTFTVGNRLLDVSDRAVQSDARRSNALNCGHRACQGCGEALGARYAVDAAVRAAEGNLVAVNATGCLEVFSTPYPGDFLAGGLDALACSAMPRRSRLDCGSDEGQGPERSTSDRAGRRRRNHRHRPGMSIGHV